MATLASDTFDGLALDAQLTGTTLNNGLGGSGTRSWQAIAASMRSDGAGKIHRPDNAVARNEVSIAGAKRWVVFVTKTTADNCVVTGLSGSGGLTGLSALLAASQTSLRIRSGASTDLASLTITPPPSGFWLELEVAGLEVTARVLNADGTVRNQVSHTAASVPSGTYCGFGLFNGGTSLKFDSFQAFDGPAESDTTAPTLSAASATAVSHSTATGSITTDEDGPAWAVVTTSATKPTEEQVADGLDHTGAAAVATGTAMLAVGVNTDAFSFAGLSGSTTYYLHIVQDDEATPPNTSAVATSASFATPAAPKHATYQFDSNEAGADAASVTGLTWAWFDAYPPDFAALPLLSGTAGATDASGVFDVVLTGTALGVGDAGTLVLSKGDGVEGSVANIGFIGPVEVR